MIDLKNKDKKNCTGCYACSSICPYHCIAMEVDSEGFWYPKVDRDKCVECKMCINVCPTINKIKIERNPIAYACINKDENVRFQSSSGGIFTLIAEKVIDNGGIVFGVEFDKEFKVVHNYIENKESLYKFRGSKYLQSIIGESYRKVKEFLDEGREVLFSGTPCQIGGLKAYLGKQYKNLFCIDIICHGVPSPKVWKKYITYHENIVNSQIRKVNFRSKCEGWKRYAISLLFENGVKYVQTFNKDLYMTAFLRDICLRPSCYTCEFKTLHRQSDITLADFWGIQNILPKLDDDKGTSLVFINSSNGQYMFDQIKNNMLYREVDIESAVFYNSSAIQPAKYNNKRDSFFEELDKLPFDELINKYCTDNIFVRIKRKVISGIKFLKRVGIDIKIKVR